MAYNTNTRLLLQFDGASATTDTSSFARACSKTAYATINTGVSPHGTGNSLYCNGKASSGNIGKVSVTAPGDLFTSSTTPWLISLRYFIEATQDDYTNGLLYFSLDDGMGGQTVSVLADYEGALIVNNGTYWLNSSPDSGNVYGTGWHHLYVYFNGNTVKIGRDGTEVASFTLGSPVLVDGYVTGMIFGDADVIPHYGGLDSIQLLENDSTWTGGSYTVPGRPDDYSAAPAPISGTGAVTLAGVTTVGEMVITGTGVISGAGVVTLSDVQSATSLVLGPTPYNLSTRLQMRFNEANGATSTADSSIFGRASTFVGSAKISSTRSKYGGGSLALGNVGGTAAHGYVRIESPEGIFSTASNLPKTFDLFFAVDGAVPSTGSALLTVKLANGDSFSIYRREVYYVPSSAYVHTIAARYIQAGSETTTHDTALLPFDPPDTSFIHARVRVDGSTIRIGLNGTDYGTVSRNGGGNIWQLSDVTEILLGSWSGATTSYAVGYLDSLVVLENDSSWTGGAYLVPSNEPEDPGAVPDILGEGITTLADVTNTCSAELLIVGDGSSLLDAVTSTGTGTVDSATDITGVSAVVIDDVVSVSTGELICTGVGEAQLSDAAGTGAGELPLAGVGATTVGVLSSGQASVSLTGTGDTSIDVTSNGLAGVLIRGVGVTTLADVISSGYANSVLVGEGASIVSMISSGFGDVLIVGEGQTKLGDVKTYHTPGHDWHVGRFSVRTQRNEMRVKL